MDRSVEFRKQKVQCLSNSRKGCVAEGVVDVMQVLNTWEQFFTTSSCVGRKLLIDGWFYNCLPRALERETITNSHPKIKEKNNPSCSPKKERNPAKAHGKRIPEENDKEMENDVDDD
ncbi:tRNA wybutosine-synthesizing protein 3-like protein [Heterocephalus glaber]|uniref:tRNA wybutosine-synthesizing protein 3 homolog n=1 Tax=Heterocephalus glaber TaxID=10181 RepID=G5C7K9_HETGA|nr:tRNA wybutosine-synthesizing protein 3-like protein [Heterocephalus glaber]